MSFPHHRILILLTVLLIGLAASLVPVASNAQNTSPQRLRIRVEHKKLAAGQETKVIVEFLDMNYNPVVNDAKREIVIGQVSAGSRQTGGGYFKPADRISDRTGRRVRIRNFRFQPTWPTVHYCRIEGVGVGSHSGTYH